MQHTTDFLVTADDWVELAFASQVVEVLGETVQRVVVLFGVLRVDLLALAELLDSGLKVTLINALVFQHLRGSAVAFEDGQQQVLDGNILVAHLLGLRQGIVENLADLRRVIQFSTAAARL